jgi:phosphoglycolate phosphatase-like HAD superfamily hydrolase
VDSVILDADGVFLCERPYWNTALATVLRRAGLEQAVRDRWEELADVAFEEFGLQRVTKTRGCNSNWDLAVVLDRALAADGLRGRIAELLSSSRHREAVARLLDAVDGLTATATAGSSGDPLEVFGIERTDAAYRSVVTEFQEIYAERIELSWRFERERLCEPLPALSVAFEALTAAGHELRVCTGRHRREIEGPIARLGLDRFLHADRITCADDVERAERLTGRRALGKPHGFPPLCAALGFEAAVAALDGKPLSPASGSPCIYVGDAPADYLAASRARAIGLDIRYAHVRSPASPDALERRLAADRLVLGVVDRLTQLPALLGRGGRA